MSTVTKKKCAINGSSQNSNIFYFYFFNFFKKKCFPREAKLENTAISKLFNSFRLQGTKRLKSANYEKYTWSDGDLCEKVTLRLSNGNLNLPTYLPMRQ